MLTAILVQMGVVGLIVWSSCSYDGSDVIPTGKGVLGPVDWTKLAGFQKTILQAHLAFSIRHA